MGKSVRSDKEHGGHEGGIYKRCADSSAEKRDIEIGDEVMERG
jgi:hypothetical protein